MQPISAEWTFQSFHLDNKFSWNTEKLGDIFVFNFVHWFDELFCQPNVLVKWDVAYYGG